MIILNNTREDISTNQLTVSGLLKIKNFTFKMLVVKINGTLVKKDEYDRTFIAEGDDVMVLHLISGG
jgi:sulfur carrier protein